MAAGLALLGFLGTSPNSDVLAHLFGFAIGAVVGALIVLVPDLRERRRLQAVLACTAAGVVIGCWLLALS
jgi:membrane associated rhomboid family serine protease